MSTLNVNIPDSIYKSLQEIAQQDNISIEQFIATAIAEKISVLMNESYLQERANRGSREKYESVLAKVSDIEPEDYDKLTQA
ncbi:toxin-antitoxin system HicB family antitoxin [Argonema antarcticum]|uniref:toxin-antitoxin system HicB family antitoxin n=1 Tax=Argonema antarcticum TaxID=2942763 RepID=UPI0020127FE2|nr:toxin-antitoxin system HicB family antitoxin [Argonema antarcticum]MCL1475524.1 toxin-antitoxin system HicB family antitoxin [Argonema antarcticum A004/B2]